MFSNPRTNFTRLLLPAFLIICFCGCRKDKAGVNIEGITGHSWNIYWLTAQITYQGSSWVEAVPFPHPSQIQLNSDQTFAVSLSGAAGSGTYSWTAVDSANAKVTFNISKWPDADVKLKTVLQSVDACSISKYPQSGGVQDPSYSHPMELHFSGSEGSIDVAR